MRHGVKLNRLGRPASHRKALIMNLAKSLLDKERIVTTEARAKALKSFVEKMITKGKSDHTHSRRQVFRYLRSKSITQKVFEDIAPRYASRPGGYTRIVKLYERKGDNARMVLIELVEEGFLAKTSKKSAAPVASSAPISAPSTDSAMPESTPVAEESVSVNENTADSHSEETQNS